MKQLAPPTLVQLTLLGFVVVALPLIGAIVTAIASVNGFAKSSHDALISVQHVTSTSRLLADRITEMERSARQFHALSDPTFKEMYNTHRDEAVKLFALLESKTQPNRMQTTLANAKQSELAANTIVNAIGSGTMKAHTLEAAFATLREDVLSVVADQDAKARTMSNAMPDRAALLQSQLVGRAAFAIPISGGLAILFALLISRPIRKIGLGIRALGTGVLTEPVRVTGTRDVQDLGERLNWLRLRLLELEVQKTRFLRNVSHELKTPLTNIREAAELLLNADEETAKKPGRHEDEQGSITRILRDNSIRLQAMIEELLRFSTDSDYEGQPNRSLIELDQLVGNAIERFRLPVATRTITVSANLASVTVMGNANRLRVVIDNLLSNAFKYTPAAGFIEITLAQHPGRAVLDVVDSGPGVQTQDVPYLFDWFHTGPKPLTSNVAGTGMGLAIAQEYAHQHNGAITFVESTRGAHFRLTLMGQ